MKEPGGVIFDIDHFASHDGPGIRTIVYFKGCPMRCLWCHSPESLKKEPEPVYIRSKCKSCVDCADIGCIYEAKRTCGSYITASRLVDEIVPQKVFFDSSGGGVTLSGGEPLFQPEFLAALLRSLKDENIHTIVETTMFCEPGTIKEIYPLVDVFFCDLKIIEPTKHKQYTGQDNNLILSNIKLLVELKGQNNIILRVPLIPGFTDTPENITAIFKFAKDTGLSDINLLPYNPSASAKYEWLSMEYPPGTLERQSPQFLHSLLGLAPQDINVAVI